MSKPFIKPSITLKQQVELLKSRGLTIKDESFAVGCLRHISYYRLRAYWLYYEIDPCDQTHAILDGTTFEMVVSLYNFDRELRLLLLDAIERIEVAARAAWSHYLAQKYNPHGYLNPNLYPKPHKFKKNLKQLETEFDRSHDTFVAHYKSTYSKPELPPIWMAAEFISFGLLSKFYSALGVRADRKAIAKELGLTEVVFEAFIHHIATVRNICAHHGRLWNRSLTITAKIPQNPPDLAHSVNSLDDRKIYNTLTITAHVMNVISPKSQWKDKAIKTIRGLPHGDYKSMGFPENWLELPLWR